MTQQTCDGLPSTFTSADGWKPKKHAWMYPEIAKEIINVVDGGIMVDLGMGEGVLETEILPKKDFKVVGVDVDPSRCEKTEAELKNNGYEVKLTDQFKVDDLNEHEAVIVNGNIFNVFDGVNDFADVVVAVNCNVDLHKSALKTDYHLLAYTFVHETMKYHLANKILKNNGVFMNVNAFPKSTYEFVRECRETDCQYRKGNVLPSLGTIASCYGEDVEISVEINKKPILLNEEDFDLCKQMLGFAYTGGRSSNGKKLEIWGNKATLYENGNVVRSLQTQWCKAKKQNCPLFYVSS